MKTKLKKNPTHAPCIRSMNMSSHARTLICLAPDIVSYVKDTLASLASRNSFEIDEILFASHRVIGIKITPNITPPTNARPICVYNR